MEKKYTLQEMQQSFNEGYYLCMKDYEHLLKNKTDLKFTFNGRTFKDLIDVIDFTTLFSVLYKWSNAGDKQTSIEGW